MNPSIEVLARTVLYEGYILYPYRASAIKNRHRWTPGGLAPLGHESSFLQAECLVVGGPDSILSVCARFLHPLLRTEGVAPPVQEATEREVEVPGTPLGDLATPRQTPFNFPTLSDRDGNVERLQYAVEGMVEVSASLLECNVSLITVGVENLTLADQDDVELRSLASAHVVLHVRDGEFVSLTDPPDSLCLHAIVCRNLGVWPVLVGEPGSRNSMIASPIILPDYPQIAPESSGDFFDGTEIDEMLALRVLTLTDAEKREMAAEPRSRAILERVESQSESAIRRLHGAIRVPVAPKAGDRVRLRPHGRADAFDILLAGKMATVVSVEVDFEDTTYLTVTVDDDPGQDLGTGGMPGHRFFFRRDEVETL